MSSRGSITRNALGTRTCIVMTTELCFTTQVKQKCGTAASLSTIRTTSTTGGIVFQQTGNQPNQRPRRPTTVSLRTRSDIYKCGSQLFA
jgi:hypothetical protein